MSVLANLIARNHRLLAAGITPVGSSIGAGTTSGGATTTPITLPAGAQAGDVALITINTSNATSGLSITSPVMAQVLAPFNYASSSGAYEYVAAYLYTLTVDDITAGSLTVTTSAVAAETCAMDVFRGVSMTPGVVGSVGKGVAPKSSTTDMTAPGITTLVDGALVVYLAGWMYGGGSNTIGGPPAGFTLDGDYYYESSTPQALAHRAPADAGATGSATMALTAQCVAAGDWAAVLIALKPVGAPTPFALSGAFPSATVGTAWTGVLTFSGDYTGPVVMDVAAGTLPAWIGAPVVDENAKTATYTGTPATGDIGTDTFTPRATPATGTAATSEQSFAVSAASAGITFVGGAPFYNPSGDAALPSGCQAGDFAVFGINARYSSDPTALPAGSITALAVTAYYSTSRYTGLWGYFLKQADVDAGTLGLSTSSAYGGLGVFRGVNVTAPFEAVGALASSNVNTRPVQLTAPSITTTVGANRMLLHMGELASGGGKAGTYAAPSGFDLATANVASSYFAIGLAYALQAAAGATGDKTATFDNSNFSPGNTAVLVALKPA